MSCNLRIGLRGGREMKERNEVSDSGHACDVCGLYLAEAGLPRSAMRPPLEIVAGQARGANRVAKKRRMV